MFPKYVNIAPKGEDTIVGLREVDFDFVPSLLGYGTDESKFATCAEGDTNSYVLGTSSLRIERTVCDGKKDNQQFDAQNCR